MFIGRTTEMSELNRLYGPGSFEMPVIYGRRRVGKTRLITEFIQDKKAIYFQARRTNAEANLHGFSQAILAGSVGAAGVSFRSFDEAFDALATMARTERLIVVIDEYPYLAQSNPEISSLLQDKIDHLYKETRLMLILCGSSLSFMAAFLHISRESILPHRSRTTSNVFFLLLRAISLRSRVTC